MKTANKLTIALSPEEVKDAIVHWMYNVRWNEVGMSRLDVSFSVEPEDSDHMTELTREVFTGATVEVTQP